MFSDKDNSNHNNSKKILCFNMLNKQKCNYGNKCDYAHNLSEQQIEPLRHKVYTMIKSSTDLSHIDMVNDHQLYETMLQLTKVCSTCLKGICPGGYNCRNGVFNIKLKICYEDLVYGNCKKINCQYIHLTDKGLIPYLKQKNKDKNNNIKKTNKSDEEKDKRPKYKSNNNNYNNNNINTTNNNTNNYNNNNINNNTNNNINNSDVEKENKSSKLKKELDEVKGVLLTENFLITHLGKNLNNIDSSDSESEYDFEQTMKYLNDNDCSEDESIFLV